MARTGCCPDTDTDQHMRVVGRALSAIALAWAWFAMPAAALAVSVTPEQLISVAGQYKMACGSPADYVTCAPSPTDPRIWQAIVWSSADLAYQVETDATEYPLSTSAQSMMVALHDPGCGDTTGMTSFVAETATLTDNQQISADIGDCAVYGKITLPVEGKPTYTVTSYIRVPTSGATPTPTPTPTPIATPTPTSPATRTRPRGQLRPPTRRDRLPARERIVRRVPHAIGDRHRKPDAGAAGRRRAVDAERGTGRGARLAARRSRRAARARPARPRPRRQRRAALRGRPPRRQRAARDPAPPVHGLRVGALQQHAGKQLRRGRGMAAHLGPPSRRHLALLGRADRHRSVPGAGCGRLRLARPHLRPRPRRRRRRSSACSSGSWW